jgi:hypothetical protein
LAKGSAFQPIQLIAQTDQLAAHDVERFVNFGELVMHEIAQCGYKHLLTERLEFFFGHIGHYARGTAAQKASIYLAGL